MMALPAAAALTPSAGCGAEMTIGQAGTRVGPLVLDKPSAILGFLTEYWVTLPADYDPAVAYPLVFYFHGWGQEGNADTLYSDEGIERGFIVVSPTGYNDFSTGKTAGSPHPTSWKAAGTYGAGLESGLQRACSALIDDNCYIESCGHCEDNCGWTTCEDSVQQILWLLEEAKNKLCVDTDQIYSTGYSNGGVFSWELATDPRSGDIFAGILPGCGDQMVGHLAPPVKTQDLTVVSVNGAWDPWMPTFATGFFNKRGRPGVVHDMDVFVSGYYYMSQRSTTFTFAERLGCTGYPVAIDTSQYNDPWLTCFAWLDCNPGAKVVECVANSGHYTPSYTPKLQMDLVWGEPAVLGMMESLEVKAKRMLQRFATMIPTIIPVVKFGSFFGA